MEVTIFHKNLTEGEGRFFDDYVAEKMAVIEALLTKYAHDAVILKINVEKFEKHNAFDVEFVLNLPGKSLVAKEASHTPNKAVDLAKDRLVAQIKKHLAHLRNDRQHESVRQPEVVMRMPLANKG